MGVRAGNAAVCAERIGRIGGRITPGAARSGRHWRDSPKDGRIGERSEADRPSQNGRQEDMCTAT